MKLADHLVDRASPSTEGAAKSSLHAEDQQILRALKGLASNQPQQAWEGFLQSYSSLILQVVHLFERDADHVADCFLFVCEQLGRRQFRRLRAFQPEGPAKFSTWLGAVVRNLCVDWHRREFGRQRMFQSVARLSSLDQEVCRCVYERRLSLDETLMFLGPRFSRLGREQLEQSVERLQQSLSRRQLWLLNVRNEASGVLNFPPDKKVLEQIIADPGPDPESLAERSETRAALARAISRLSKAERLLLQLRFEQGLTLEKMARLTKAGSAETVHRRIQETLQRLRKEMLGFTATLDRKRLGVRVNKVEAEE